MPDTLLEKPRPLARGETHPAAIAHGEAWAIVLAGGEGSRLRHWTRTAEGVAIPKQFCRFRPEGSLLSMTLARAGRLVSRDHILVLLNESHRPLWSAELAELPEENVLVQPRNLGTAVAILHALVRVLVRDHAPMVVVMPSDHDVELESVFLNAAEQAMTEARRSIQHPVLLGITPEDPDPALGWIVTAAPHGTHARVVLSFVEKPAPAVAARLMSWGALWNSFVIASSATALLSLYEDTQPTLLEMYFQGLGYAHGNPDGLARLYRMLPGRDFGCDVLAHVPHRLRALAVPACGWVDLGTPERVSRWLERHRDSPLNP